MDENIRKYYQVLNLEPNASPEEIYQAYRDMARVWDPQRFAHSPRLELKAEAKLREVIAAYHALLPSGGTGAVPGAGAPQGNMRDAEEPGGPVRESDPFGGPDPGRPMVADRYRSHDSFLPMESAPPRPQLVPGAPPQQERPPALPQQPAAQSQAAQAPPAATPLTQTPVAQAPPAQPVPAEAPPVPAPPPAMPGALPAAPPAPRELPPLTAKVQITPAGTPPPPAKSLPTADDIAAESAGMRVEKPKKLNPVHLMVAGAVGLVIVAAGIFFIQAFSSQRPSTTLPEPPVAASSTPMEPAPSSAGADTTSGTSAEPPRPEPDTPSSTRKHNRKSASSPVEDVRHYPNGTELLSSGGRSGVGQFRIVNQSGQEVVARISSTAAPDSALRLIYIQVDSEVNLNNIAPGVYYVSFSMGAVTSKARRYGTRYGPFQFMQIQSVNGYQSDHYQIVIKPQP